VEQLTAEIANLRRHPGRDRRGSLRECHQILLAREYLLEGDSTTRANLLEQALGRPRAEEILARLEGSVRTTGSAKLQNIDPRQLASFVRGEHPQTIAPHPHAAAPAPGRGAPVGPDRPNSRPTCPARGHHGEDLARGAGSGGAGAGTPVRHRSRRRGLRVRRAKQIAEILNLMEIQNERRISQVRRGREPGAGDADQESDVCLRGHRPSGRPVGAATLKEIPTRDLAIALKAPPRN